MKNTHIFTCILIFFGSHFSCFGGAEAKVVPTHAEAALIVAKYSGLFDRYVSEKATLSECVSFLNEKGIYFGLMEVVNGKDFTLKDSARVLGQVELLLSGEAEYFRGKVKLPKNIDSWEDFCIMNGVEYVEGYKAIVEGAERLRRIRG